MRALLVAVPFLLLPALAYAQHTPSASEVAMARQQFDAGVQHAQAGQWDQAVALFQRSYDVAPRAVTLLNLAAAQVQTHHYVAATESYRRYLATASDRDLQRYRAQAETALHAAESKIGRATVRADGLLDADAVTIDGESIPHAAIGIAMPLDPGTHTAALRRGNTEVTHRTFELTEGGTTAVELPVPPPSPGDVAVAGEGNRDGSAAAVGGDVFPRRHHDDGGLLASPVFWTVVVLIVAAAIVIPIVVVTTSSSPEPFTGNTMPGMIIVP